MDFSSVVNNYDFLLKGLKITASLALTSICASMIIGTVLGVLRYSKLCPLNLLAAGFIEITRSIPLLLYILFVHFSISPYLYNNSNIASLLGVSSLELQSACVALILFTSAYIAEIIRGGLKSVECGYLDAAKALGLNAFQRLKYIILPIAISRMIPALTSQFIALTKDTSLASAIGLIELTRAGEIIYERTHNEFEILCVIALVYFVICYSISLFGRVFEKKKLCFVRFD